MRNSRPDVVVPVGNEYANVGKFANVSFELAVTVSTAIDAMPDVESYRERSLPIFRLVESYGAPAGSDDDPTIVMVPDPLVTAGTTMDYSTFPPRRLTDFDCAGTASVTEFGSRIGDGDDV